MSETLCKVNKKGNILKKTLLWVNPHPTQSISSGTFDLETPIMEDIREHTYYIHKKCFDLIRIIWKQRASETDSSENRFIDWHFYWDTTYNMIAGATESLPNVYLFTSDDAFESGTTTTTSGDYRSYIRRLSWVKSESDSEHNFKYDKIKIDFCYAIKDTSDTKATIVKNTSWTNLHNIPVAIYGINFRQPDEKNIWANEVLSISLAPLPESDSANIGFNELEKLKQNNSKIKTFSYSKKGNDGWDINIDFSNDGIDELMQTPGISAREGDTKKNIILDVETKYELTDPSFNQYNFDYQAKNIIKTYAEKNHYWIQISIEDINSKGSLEGQGAPFPFTDTMHDFSTIFFVHLGLTSD